MHVSRQQPDSLVGVRGGERGMGRGRKRERERERERERREREERTNSVHNMITHTECVSYKLLT